MQALIRGIRREQKQLMAEDAISRDLDICELLGGRGDEAVTSHVLAQSGPLPLPCSDKFLSLQ